MELTKSVPVSEADKPVREFAEMVFKTVARDQTVGVDLTNLLQALFPDCRASWVMRDDRIHLSLDLSGLENYRFIYGYLSAIHDELMMKDGTGPVILKLDDLMEEVYKRVE